MPATKSMKAARYLAYGPPSSIQVERIDIPEPAADQVLLRVAAASINPLDWHLVTGTPYIVRLDGGLRTPKRSIPGADVAGIVEAVGAEVTDLALGDEVFGWTEGGGCAQYVAVAADRLAAKPEHLSFAQVAAVPIAAITALQGLRDKGGIAAAQQVLINGASGGVGSYAIQIAKALGAEVTAVCSSGNVDLAVKLGADRVIDYTREDFVAIGGAYDIVFDVPGNRSLSSIRRIMADGGRYVLIGGSKARVLGPLPRLAKMLLLSPFVSQSFRPLLSKENAIDLETLRLMLDDGRIESVIDRSYDLDGVAEAVEYQGQGRAKGKIIITP